MQEISHEELLERALLAAMTDVDLADVAEESGVARLDDSIGDAVSVDQVVSLVDAGFLTDDRGVCVRLSDGSEFTVEIKMYRQPRG